MRNIEILILCAVVFLNPLRSHAAAAECSDATDAYNSTASDLRDAVRRYMRCLSTSGGHDDCSSESRRLKNAQFDFETAVSEYQSECD